MNEWLAAAPQAQVAHGMTGCMVSLEDMADCAPRVLADGEVIDLGGKRIRYIDTPMSPMAEMLASSMRKRPGRCSAATCSPISGMAPP